MKIIICTTEYPPTHSSGIGNVVYNVVKNLKKKGIDCTVCSPVNGDIHLGSVWLTNKFGVIGLMYYWHCVSKYFRNNDFDAAWLQNPFFIRGSPFRNNIVTMHSTIYGMSYYKVNKSLFMNIYKYIESKIEKFCLTRMNKNTQFTGVGSNVCEELEKIGISRERIIYILNGVNTRQFHPSPDKKLLRGKFGIPEDDIVLLSVGRLTPQKQPLTMIEVFSHLENKLENVTLCIAGRGEILEATKDLAWKIGLRKVLFPGYVDDQDLPDLYACADYYIMTSKYEGGQPPLTLAEAMASGLPCIVSDIPNLGIVNQADCGITINFRDAEEAASKTLSYINSEHRDHSDNARRFAENVFDWRLIATEYQDELVRVCNESNIDYGHE